jgi:hypothetical protein
VLISPKSDSHNIIAVKDPSVVFFNGQWQVFASTVNSSGSYSLIGRIDECGGRAGALGQQAGARLWANP